MGDIGKYFNRKEFGCPDGCGFDNISQELVDMLDDIREEMNEPMIINSGCRCKKYNKKIGGASNSAHLRGLAVDIHAIGDHRARLLPIIEEHFIRRGYGKTFVHIDIDDSLPQTQWVYGIVNYV